MTAKRPTNDEPTHTVCDLFGRMGDPDTTEGELVWKVAWLVDHGHLPSRAVKNAANGPKQVGGVVNKIGYFRRCLENDIGQKNLRRALRRLPRRRKWRTDNPNRVERSPFLQTLVADFAKRHRSPPEPKPRTSHDVLMEIAQAVRETK